MRRTYDQACPVAHALDVVGERWTLLIVRDLLFGPLRFSDLRDGLPGLAPNLLTDRLRFLVGTGLVERVEDPPPPRRTVYRLTERGRELGPVVHELSRFGIAEWGDPDRAPPPPHLLRGAVLSLMAPERLDGAGWRARLRLPTAELLVLVEPAGPDEGRRPLARLRLRDPDRLADDERSAPVDVEVTTTLGTLLALRRGELDLDRARADGRLAVVGRPAARTRVGRLLGWP